MIINNLQTKYANIADFKEKISKLEIMIRIEIQQKLKILHLTLPSRT